MKIHALDIAGFGRLRGRVQFDPSRMTIIVAPNEAGKTTLADAIRAVLYGVSSHRYRPWDGGPYGVAADVECAGTPLRIERDLAHGAVRAPDGVRPESLTGLTDEEFTRVAVMRREAPSPQANASLAARIERMMDSNAGAVSSAEALDALRRARPTDALRTLQLELARAEDDKRAVDAAYDAAAVRAGELAAVIERDGALAREHVAAQIVEARERITEIRQRELLAAERTARSVTLAREKETLRGAGVVPASLWERVAHLTDRYRELDDKRRTTDRDVRDLTVRTRELERDLSADPALASLTAADADAAAAAADRVTRAQSALAAEEDALQRGEATARAEGWDPEWARTLVSRVQSASEEERGFLTRYRDAHTKLRSSLEEDRLALASATEERTIESNRSSSERGLLLWLAGAGGVVALLSGLPLLFSMAVTQSLPPALLPALAGGGGVLGVGAAIALSWQARQRANVDRELAQVEDDLRAAMRTKAAGIVRMESHLSELSHAIGCPAGRDILADIGGAPRVLASLDPLTQRAAGARDELRLARDEAQTVLARAARAVPDAETHPQALAEAARAVARDVRARQERQSMLRAEAERKSAHKAQLTGLLQEGGSLVADVEEVAQAVGIQSGDPAAMLAQLSEGVARARRLSAIDAEEKESNSGAVAVMSDPHATETIRSLEDRIAEWTARDPRAAQPASSGSVKAGRVHDIAREREALASTRDALRADVHRLSADNAARRSDAARAVREMRRQLTRAERRASALELAHDTLAKVVAASHESWAELLTAECASMLDTVAPGVGRIAFAPDLSLSVVRPDGRRLDATDAAQVLSGGARDQVDLAVRVAIARFLAGDTESVPLILDDPFQAADDERAMSGLQFLVEAVVPHHQVILLTCQASRIEAFLARDAALADKCALVEDLPS